MCSITTQSKHTRTHYPYVWSQMIHSISTAKHIENTPCAQHQTKVNSVPEHNISSTSETLSDASWTPNCWDEKFHVSPSQWETDITLFLVYYSCIFLQPITMTSHERNCVSNHRQSRSCFNSLFILPTKKTSKWRITSSCERNPPDRWTSSRRNNQGPMSI